MDQQLMALVAATITLGAAMFGSSRWLNKSIRAVGEASKERDLALEKTIRATGEASKERDLALEKTARAAGEASRDRDHAIEKRLDDLREDLRAGYGVAPTANQPAQPAVVAEA